MRCIFSELRPRATCFEVAYCLYKHRTSRPSHQGMAALSRYSSCPELLSQDVFPPTSCTTRLVVQDSTIRELRLLADQIGGPIFFGPRTAVPVSGTKPICEVEEAKPFAGGTHLLLALIVVFVSYLHISMG